MGSQAIKQSIVMEKPVTIVLDDCLSPAMQSIIACAKSYHTMVLIYEDDYSEQLEAAWTEQDRLRLNTRMIGVIYNGIEVHSFGLNAFKPNSVLELSLREASAGNGSERLNKSVYKSLLNELTYFTVRCFSGGEADFCLETR